MDEREASDRFFLLVEEYRLAGWMGLGKIRRPESEDARPDLALARHAIDTLGMLEVKTRGNRSDPEERLLRQSLADLRLNFADEVKRVKEGQQAPPPQPGSPEPKPETPGPESPVAGSPGPPPTPNSPGPESPKPEPASQGESPPASGSGP